MIRVELRTPGEICLEDGSAHLHTSRIVVKMTRFVIGSAILDLASSAFLSLDDENVIIYQPFMMVKASILCEHNGWQTLPDDSFYDVSVGHNSFHLSPCIPGPFTPFSILLTSHRRTQLHQCIQNSYILLSRWTLPFP